MDFNYFFCPQRTQAMGFLTLSILILNLIIRLDEIKHVFGSGHFFCVFEKIEHGIS
jgi:hypothetical protein